MRFVKTYKMNVPVLEEQEKQLSSKDKIEKACLRENVMAFDIFDGELLVGFAMLRKYEEGGYFLWNYAIDRKYQNRHYGTRALTELIAVMRDEYGLREMSTTYLWGNDHARRVYEKVGFTETDVVDEDGCHEVNMIYIA